ncbi:MAG: 30S ribosomal protein S20 [Minisyncoccia bacterium]
MAITQSAKKALRVSKRRRVFNLRRKSEVERAVKSFKKLLASGDKKGTLEAMRQVQSALDKAVKGKTLKKNNAARKKSRLSKLLKKL